MPRKYWQDRIQEQNKKNYKRLVQETEKELAEIYSEQAEELRLSVIDVLAKIQAAKGTEEGIRANDLFLNRRYWTLLDEINARLKKLGHKQIDISSQVLLRRMRKQ